VGRTTERRLDQDRRDAWSIERGRDDVRRQSIVEVAAVAQLDLLDRGVADGLERPALDLALGEDRVDDAADVVGGHDVADMHLAGVEIDIDAGDAGRPSEGRVCVAGVGRVVERRAAGVRLELLVDPRRAVLLGVGGRRGRERPAGGLLDLPAERLRGLDEQAAHDHRRS
jgi:hypothetical protein